jgi:hypothetical protein
MMSTRPKLRLQAAGDLGARSNARVRSGNRHDLRPLSPEERMTYRRWMRGVWILYGAVAVILGGLAFTGNFPTTIAALEKGAAHATLAAESR